MCGAAHTKCLSLSSSNDVILAVQWVMVVFQSVFEHTKFID
jgi:hypothetical protein